MEHPNDTHNASAFSANCGRAGIGSRSDAGTCPERSSVPNVRITIRLGHQLDRLYYDRFRGKLLIFSQCQGRNIEFQRFTKAGAWQAAEDQQGFLRLHVEGGIQR